MMGMTIGFDIMNYWSKLSWMVQHRKFRYIISLFGFWMTIYGLGKIDLMETTSVLYITLPIGFLLTLAVLAGKDFSIPIWSSQFIYWHSGIMIGITMFTAFLLTQRYYSFSENEKKIWIKQKDILTFSKDAEINYVPEKGWLALKTDPPSPLKSASSTSS